MKAATVKQIKDELAFKSQKELVELCLRLARFKKENKELLTYLLFVADQDEYIEMVQREIDEQFSAISSRRYYFVSKSVRKILRMIKKHIRYTLRKETEAELLLYFCKKLKDLKPPIGRHKALTNLYNRQLEMAEKAISKLHEDLQYDYGLLVEELNQ